MVSVDLCNSFSVVQCSVLCKLGGSVYITQVAMLCAVLFVGEHGITGHRKCYLFSITVVIK